MILFSDSENVDYKTEPSIYRQETYGRMILSMRGQEDDNNHQTYISIWNDDRPYTLIKGWFVDFPGHLTTVAHDRRSKEEQLADPYLIMCFRDEDKNHKIGRVELCTKDGQKFMTEGEMIMSNKIIDEECYECMIMAKDLVVTFH